MATERSGLEFYTRAAMLTSDPRGRAVFQRLAEEEKEHLGTLEKRYAELLATDPLLESRPTFLFFKGAANGIFAEGAEKLSAGVDDLQALLIGIKCERDSHKFFKKYGDRFEDSEGKQVFLEFAEEERAHRDLLIAELSRPARASQAARSAQSRGRPYREVIDLHTHHQRVRWTSFAGPAGRQGRERRAAGPRPHRPRHGCRLAGRRRGVRSCRHRVRDRHRDHRGGRWRRRPRPRLLRRCGFGRTPGVPGRPAPHSPSRGCEK